jgi:hypothetical protein
MVALDEAHVFPSLMPHGEEKSKAESAGGGGMLVSRNSCFVAFLA